MDRSQNFVRDFPLQEKVDILNYATRGLFNSFRRSVEDVAERNNICRDQVLWDLVLPGNRFMSILALSVYSGNYLRKFAALLIPGLALKYGSADR